MLHEYVAVMTDPGHLMAEGTLMVLENVIVGVLFVRLRRLVKREHLTIDLEHGVDHDRDRIAHRRAYDGSWGG